VRGLEGAPERQLAFDFVERGDALAGLERTWVYPRINDHLPERAEAHHHGRHVVAARHALWRSSALTSARKRKANRTVATSGLRTTPRGLYYHYLPGNMTILVIFGEIKRCAKFS
jgi:hypothetical protein